MRTATSFFQRLAAKQVAKNSVWMFLGFGLRLIIQALYFLLIARSLGVEEYGAFVAVTAFVQILAPFSGLGVGSLLVKHVARDKSAYHSYWGKALGSTFFSGILLIGLTAALKSFAFSKAVSWNLVLVVGLSDLLAARIVEVAGQAFQAFDRLKYTAQLNLLPNVLRLLCAAAAFFYMHQITARQWGWFYLTSSVVSAVVAIVVTDRKLGKADRLAVLGPREVMEGIYFSTSVAAQTLYNDLDKTMLARMSTLEATGIYAVAYRFVDVSFTPIRSVLYATYASFFRKGQENLGATWKYLLKLLPVFSGYSLAVSFLLFLGSNLIPVFLGKEYAQAAIALRWLAFLPVLKSLHYPAADALTGAGYQRSRTVIQVGIALINAGLNLWLLPRFSWRGAAWASLASDALLVLGMFGMLWFALRHPSAGPDVPKQLHPAT